MDYVTKDCSIPHTMRRFSILTIKNYPHHSAEISTACFRIDKQSPFCGRKQTNRNPRHAGSACAEWHRTQLQARRIVHDHPRYRIRGCRTKRFNRVDIKSPTLMKTKTEFLVICFLTGFSVCFLFCGVCSYLSDSG